MKKITWIAFRNKEKYLVGWCEENTLPGRAEDINFVLQVIELNNFSFFPWTSSLFLRACGWACDALLRTTLLQMYRETNGSVI